MPLPPLLPPPADIVGGLPYAAVPLIHGDFETEASGPSAEALAHFACGTRRLPIAAERPPARGGGGCREPYFSIRFRAKMASVPACGSAGACWLGKKISTCPGLVGGVTPAAALCTTTALSMASTIDWIGVPSSSASATDMVIL